MLITFIELSLDALNKRSVDLIEGNDAQALLKQLGIRLPEGAVLSRFGQKIALDETLNDEDEICLCPKVVVNPREMRAKRAIEQGDVRVVTCGRHGGQHRLAVTPASFKD